jgi:hypothetical protein
LNVVQLRVVGVFKQWLKVPYGPGDLLTGDGTLDAIRSALSDSCGTEQISYILEQLDKLESSATATCRHCQTKCRGQRGHPLLPATAKPSKKKADVTIPSMFRERFPTVVTVNRRRSGSGSGDSGEDGILTHAAAMENVPYLNSSAEELPRRNLVAAAVAAVVEGQQSAAAGMSPRSNHDINVLYWNVPTD